MSFSIAVLLISFCPVADLMSCQIGFRALRFDFVKGYAARFQTVRGLIQQTSRAHRCSHRCSHCIGCVKLNWVWGSAVRNMFEPRVRPMPWQRTGMEMPMGYFSKLGKIWKLPSFTRFTLCVIRVGHTIQLNSYIIHYTMIEGSLEVKLPTIWTDEKQSREEAERRERLEERRVRRKKMQMREKVGKSGNIVFFQWFVAPEGRKVGSQKRRVRSQLARWEMKNCTPLWREACFEVKMHKTPGARSTFGSWDVKKVHAVVARSTFPSQNVQNTPLSDHFWKLRCRKSACRCGAKHISKSKCTKHLSVGPLLEVTMSKKCTPLWREAHFEVKMYKAHHVRTTFGSCDVEKVHAVVARSTFPSQNLQTHHAQAIFGGSDVVSRGRRKGFWTLSKVSKTWWFCSIFNYNYHYTTLHSNALHYNYNYNYTFTTFYYTTLHCTQLHYTTLHYTPLHSATVHYTTLHYTTLHYATLHYLPLHFTTLHYTPLHYNYNYNCTTTLHNTPLH